MSQAIICFVLSVFRSQLCINTAIVYMHRFYAFHSFTLFHRNIIAAAAFFLAAKVGLNYDALHSDSFLIKLLLRFRLRSSRVS